MILQPVCFDATTSYQQGTCEAPSYIYSASSQLDLYHPLSPNAWKKGIYMLPAQELHIEANINARKIAQQVRRGDGNTEELLKQINSQMKLLEENQYSKTKEILDARKISGLIGGDHSCPLGHIRAHIENYPSAGILHFDAHYDLRKAYEGFEQSHASIMYNVLQKTKVSKLVNVGIRDYCEEEENLVLSDSRIKDFKASHLFAKKAIGENWHQITNEILDQLPDEIYVSFDVDGLDPSYCPHTGTPVPGGLSFEEAIYLLRQIYRSGKQVIGFDVCETGPSEYDANVAARLVYELSILSIISRPDF